MYNIPAEKHMRTLVLDRQQTHATTVVALSFRLAIYALTTPAVPNNDLPRQVWRQYHRAASLRAQYLLASLALEHRTAAQDNSSNAAPTPVQHECAAQQQACTPLRATEQLLWLQCCCSGDAKLLLVAAGEPDYTIMLWRWNSNKVRILTVATPWPG